MGAIAYYILQNLIVATEGPSSPLAQSLGRDWKGKLSALLYAIAVGVSFVRPWIAGCIYVAVALVWLIPDRRLMRVVNHPRSPERT